MKQFTDLGLVPPILATLAAEGYEQPTPIQAAAIPSILAGRDLLGIAATGTGKTAAFALPILQRLSAAGGAAPRGGCRVLVLVPTRELAAQIAESFRTYGRKLRLSVAVVVGGVAFKPQVTVLARGVDVLVATPGRLLDHVGRGSARLDAATVLVLDEADHMLDLGFIPDVRRLVQRLPRERQTLLFSATMPREIRSLADDFLSSPETVSVAPPATPAERIDQRLIHVAAARKSALLAEVLRDGGHDRVLVFTRTKRGADRVVRGLAAVRIEAQAIHGNKSQGQRERALAGFRTGRAPVLVATDIAARGIDVDGIGLVVNYDLPHVPETYVHRIGRTARAGAAGAAVSFCGPEERPLLRAIETLIKSRIPAEQDASVAAGGDRREPAAPRRPEPRAKPRPETLGEPRPETRSELRSEPRQAGRPAGKGQVRAFQDLPFLRTNEERGPRKPPRGRRPAKAPSRRSAAG